MRIFKWKKIGKPTSREGLERVEDVLVSSGPKAVLHDEEKMLSAKSELMRRYHDLVGTAGALEEKSATRTKLSGARVIPRASMAVAVIAVIALVACLVIWLPGGHRQRVEQRVVSWGRVIIDGPELDWEGIISRMEVPPPSTGPVAPVTPESPEPQPGTPVPEIILPDAIQLAYALTDQGVAVDWPALSEVMSYEGIAVLRTGRGLVPVYPDNQIAFVEKGADDHYLDQEVQGQRAYSYRLALLKDGKPELYSNVAEVDIKAEINICLEGSTADSTTLLSWGVDIKGIDPGITHFVLVRSLMSSTCVLPAGTGAKSYQASGQQTEYQDNSTFRGTTYYYRVAACRGNEILTYSDVVSVVVPSGSEGSVAPDVSDTPGCLPVVEPHTTQVP